MRDSEPDIQRFVRASSLIFNGTVIELGASSVKSLSPRGNFAVVRVDHALRSDRALGELRGKTVTVELLETGELQPKESRIFFTLDWIHGGGIAAREVAHLDTKKESEVTAELARLPERHLSDRLADAVLVVVAEVTRVKLLRFDILWRNAPQWAAAALQIVQVLRGQPRENTTVLFPTSERPTWARAPRLASSQRAIFLLHRAPNWVTPPEPEEFVMREVFTVLDPADVQPESQRALVERLLRNGSSS